MESIITAKGQTTVPAQVRERLGSATGTRLAWHVTSHGAVLVRPKITSILDTAGTAKPAEA